MGPRVRGRGRQTGPRVRGRGERAGPRVRGQGARTRRVPVPEPETEGETELSIKEQEFHLGSSSEGELGDGKQMDAYDLYSSEHEEDDESV